MAKGKKRPAIERIVNKEQISAAISNISTARADLLDADQTMKEISEKAGAQLGDEMMNNLRKKFTDAAWKNLRENINTLAPMLRVGIKAIEECGDAKTISALAQWMLDKGIFPEAKKEEK